jgi:D-sedoheptulose 7-phosphate isomerase
MQDVILHSIHECIQAVSFLKTPYAVEFIEDAANMIVDCYKANGKLLIAGNGGSLCDAMHFSEEMTGFFRKQRKALGAIALSDPGHMSCVANDLAFEMVFSRALEALGQRGDLFVGLTTSGNSPNMVCAFKRAKELGLKTIAFLGKGGGKLRGVADLELVIDGFSTSDRIQEAHMAAIHIIIEAVELKLFTKTCASCI